MSGPGNGQAADGAGPGAGPASNGGPASSHTPTDNSSPTDSGSPTGNGSPVNGTGERATPQRGPGPAAGPGPARFMAGGMSTEKSLDFRGSSRRLLGTLAPHRLLVIASLVLATVSVGLSVLGPWLLGTATNLIFAGVISKRLPAGVSKAQIVAQLRREGHGRL